MVSVSSFPFRTVFCMNRLCAWLSLLTGTPQIQKLMTVMIRQHEALFPPSKDVAPSPPIEKSDKKKNSAPRSFVGWESAEVTTSHNHFQRSP